MQKTAGAFLMPFLLFWSVALSGWGCRQPAPRIVHRSFYFWKSAFRLSPTEQEVLKAGAAEQIHVKFFDVAWDEAAGKPLPVARIRARDKAPLPVTPVVFLTQEALRKIDSSALPELAQHIAGLLQSLSEKDGWPLTPEVQMDCDWTASTRDRYFGLLQALRLTPFLQGKRLSVTLRLHQLKFRSTAGIPPADRALLMGYNMGNLRDAGTRNSILEVPELKKYTGALNSYPLPLDFALPLFDWYVWLRGNRYHGLVRSNALPEGAGATLSFPGDTSINGYNFEKGDRLRYEGSHPAEVIRAARWLASQWKGKETSVILYHLDETHLDKFKRHELETIFSSFR